MMAEDDYDDCDAPLEIKLEKDSTLAATSENKKEVSHPTTKAENSLSSAPTSTYFKNLQPITLSTYANFSGLELVVSSNFGKVNNR